MRKPRVIIFDIDETLSESFQPPKPSMLERLLKLLEKFPIGIDTGAGFQRVHDHILLHLEQSPHIGRLYVLCNSSTQAYTWQNGWNQEYNIIISEDDRARIKKVLAEAERDLPAIHDTKAYGNRISDREAQVAYTIVGLEAPQDMKMAWDPGAVKRRDIIKYLEPRLPEYDIRSGGASTIDITMKGMNKAYGVRWLSERLKIPIPEMLYVGDALYEGGNDAVVIPTGIQTHTVSGPADTEKVIDDLLAY